MITVDWHDELDVESMRELTATVAEAAAYDDEAGFSTAETVQSAGSNLVLRQALARLTPGRHGSLQTPLAGYLRLEVDRAGGAQATLLVRPDLRSLGIATLMLETLATGGEPGWGGTGAVSIGCWARANHPAAERMAARFGAEPESVTFHLQCGDEIRDVNAADEAAVLAARADGFVHEHSDIRYVLRMRAGAPSSRGCAVNLWPPTLDGGVGASDLLYTPRMKRLQIYIEPEADQALAAEAARDGVSKAAIIRRLVAEHTGRNAGADPIDDLVGAFDGEAGNIDAVVYGR